MDSSLAITLSCWIILNFVVVPLVGLWFAGRRRATADRSVPSGPVGPTVSAPRRPPRTDGYAALLLARLAVQTCRLLAVERACLLVGDTDDPRSLILVAGHGIAEDAVGQRVRIEGPLDDALRSGMTQRWRAECPVPALCPGTMMASAVEAPHRLVLCAATTDSARLFTQRDVGLLGELAELSAHAVEDLETKFGLNSSVRASTARLADVEELEVEVEAPARSPIDTTVLARWIGTRLGLEPDALVELEMAGIASQSHTPGIADRLAVLPGFEVVELIVRFVDERWDGLGAQGLPGERIPLASRILAACNALRGLIAEDPSGARETVETALRRIQGDSGTVFDPTVVAAMSHELLGEMPELAGAGEADHWADADAQYAPLLG